MNLPNTIFSGSYKEGHIQGVAVDKKNGYVYYSFTTILLKTDLQGNPIGSVENLAGHLGCITYDEETNCVYGSLELKHDIIGRSIVNRTGKELALEDSFYLVSFDVKKIDRFKMDAEKDDVMKAVYLKDVLNDYESIDEVCLKKHRYGCSGIDGIGLGPVFGENNNSTKKIMVAYGIYSDVERDDNDYQIILQFDKSMINKYGLPLNQLEPHHSGPDKCEERYFFYTGNTTFGVQNLEYDSYSENWLVAVYRGNKDKFKNFNLYVIDGKIKPTLLTLDGRKEEKGLVISSAEVGENDNDKRIYGSFFPYGSTGIFSIGDGTFYFSENGEISEEKAFYSYLKKYRYNPDIKELFELVI